MSTISDLTRACLKELNELISSDALAQSQSAVPLRAWKDELGRLRLWAGNIGAHRAGQSSPDYRLRDASHIKNQTVRILEAVRKLLADLQNSLSGEKEDEEDDQLDEDLQSLVAELDLGNPSESVLTVPEAHESLVNKVSQLFDISMTVRNPAQQDRLIETEKSDAEPFKSSFRRHVSHKYPQAENQLVDRISSAMAQQRAILKYRERHHLKLSQGLYIDEDSDNSTVRLSETVASTFKLEAPGQISDDLMSNSDASFTSYAGSLLSGGEKLGIPALPREAAGLRPFECPYCHFIITLKDRQAWARHIFRDLSPYVCIFSGCSTQNKLYESRKAWYRHIRQTHMAGQDVRGSYACPLCAEGLLPMVSFEKHVGRHLEELSLFVLPRDTEDDEVLDDKSGDGEPEHGESEDGGQETESDAEREEDYNAVMTMNGITMSFVKESVGGKRIGVRTGEAGTIYRDVQDIRPKRDMSGDGLQTGDPDPTDKQDSHLIEPQQPDAQTTSRLDSSDPGNSNNGMEFSATVHAATKAAGFDPDAVAPASAEEPEPRGRRRSVGGSSNAERHPRARERAGSSHAAPVSASPPQTRPLRQDLQLLRQQEEIERLERAFTRRKENRLTGEDEDHVQNDFQSTSSNKSSTQQHRYYNLVVDQKLLERNGRRTDPEILRHQEEIERLEREVSRYRESRLAREEDDDISKRLRRLEKDEDTQRLEEWSSRLERPEAAERKGAENKEMKILRLEEAEEYQRAAEEEELREQLKKNLRKVREEEERRAKEREKKRAAVEESKLAEIKRHENELNGFNERLIGEYAYTGEEIEEILKKTAEKDNEREESSETIKKDKGKEENEQQHRHTWIKVHRKHLLPETLTAYHFPWDWDELDRNYIIIKQWIDEDIQEELFAHTRRIRESGQASNTSTELKINDRSKDKMYRLRKKNTKGREFIFT